MSNHTNLTLVKLNNLQKIFFTDDVETYALNEINLQVNQGEYISIAGPSGCGKSTLLSLLGLLDNATGGEYHLAGHNVSHLNRDERAAIRNEKIGFIFQAFNLISDLTVAENVETAEDAQLLTQLGADCLQGYHFGAPSVSPPWVRDAKRRAS